MVFSSKESSGFFLAVVLLCAVNQGMAACQDKLPMANYTADLVAGKFYLICTKPAFNYQYNELRCSTSYIESAFPKNFKFYISHQESNGIANYSFTNITNISPPGTWLVSSDKAVDRTFQASVIGAVKNKVNIYYACNAQNGKEAVWVYYYKRANGGKEMDNDSVQYTLKTFAQNQISVDGFKMVNNKKCNN